MSTGSPRAHTFLDCPGKSRTGPHIFVTETSTQPELLITGVILPEILDCQPQDLLLSWIGLGRFRLHKRAPLYPSTDETMAGR